MRSSQPSNAASFQATTRPVQKNRMMRGLVSNEQNMTVQRPFSWMCEMVSIPEPVASTYAHRFGVRMLNDDDGRPLGDRLMCLPRSGADATKNTCCFIAHSARSGSICG